MIPEYDVPEKEKIGLVRLRLGNKHRPTVFTDDRDIALALWNECFAAVYLPAPEFAQPIKLWRIRHIRELYLIRRPGPAGSRFIAAVKRHLRQIHYTGRVVVVELEERASAA